MEARIEAIGKVLPKLIRQEIFYIGPVPVTSTVISTWLVMLVLFISVWLLTRKGFKEIPTGAQAFLEQVVEFYYWIIDQGAGKEGRKFLPILGGYFTFIIFMNMSWFIPGMVPPTTDIMTTAALGVSAVLITHFVAIFQKGLGHYAKHFLSPTPIMAPMNVIEEFVKPFSLAIRLFGNMFGEKMVVSILFVLVPLAVPVPVMFLGLLMGTIQAFIFTLLTTTYLSTFTHGH